MNPYTVLVPLPHLGCDPSEVGIPCKLMQEAGFKLVFATPSGQVAQTDPVMLTGNRLSLLKPVLAARKDAVTAYNQVAASNAFLNPMKYNELDKQQFDAIYLPGGHDKPVKEYLESEILHHLIAVFFETNKPVGAICHGVVLVARSKHPQTGKSVLYNYQTTALLKSQELLGYQLTRLWMSDYYLTYPGLTVEDEVISVLKNKNQFKKGPFSIVRDTPTQKGRGFYVQDRNYISARWPGDLYRFTAQFIKMVGGQG